jgi:hypothetical protein
MLTEMEIMQPNSGISGIQRIPLLSGKKKWEAV